MGVYCLLVYIVQNLLGMDFCLYLLGSENLLDDAVFVDQIGSAENTNSASAAGYLFSPTSQRLQKCGFCISNKREGKVMGICKFLLKLLLVLADTYDVITGLSQFFLVSLK